MALTESELDDLMREVFGLQGITDPKLLRSEVDRRMATMDAIQRAEINMRIGMKASELEARVTGARYSPSTWALVVASLLMAVISCGSIVFIMWATTPRVWKVASGFVAVFTFFMSLRGLARVLFRLRNSRDW